MISTDLRKQNILNLLCQVTPASRAIFGQIHVMILGMDAAYLSYLHIVYVVISNAQTKISNVVCRKLQRVRFTILTLIIFILHNYLFKLRRHEYTYSHTRYQPQFFRIRRTEGKLNIPHFTYTHYLHLLGY
jgi:hypothetical protein